VSVVFSTPSLIVRLYVAVDSVSAINNAKELLEGLMLELAKRLCESICGLQIGPNLED
jgi:hypothetical protein